jgi:MFS family permease
MFLIMNGLGALVAAPISEVFGRNPIYIPTMILFMLFDMGAGLAQTVIQQIVCRALAGLFGSAPAVLAAASLVDIWSRIERVYMFPLFSIMAFTGPLVGPTPGDYHYLWRNRPGAASAVPTRNIQSHPARLESKRAPPSNRR